MKIGELQQEIRSAIASIGDPRLQEAAARFDIEVAFHRPGKRDIRSDADATYFDPDPAQQQEIGIRFVKREDAAPISSPPTVAAVPAPAPSPTPVSTPATILIRRLHELENDAQVKFVGLKWFRDVILPKTGLHDAEARTALDSAIKAGLVIVHKLVNPNSPFSTSTLRLNHESAEVKAVLAAGASGPSRRGFAPLDIPGLNLSEEVIRGRR
ncbi:MAG TPA: hypothetical protein VIC54_11475 [Terriglobales bacterium]|jgi:hypothetical protein